jgi:hypothetical protein
MGNACCSQPLSPVARPNRRQSGVAIVDARISAWRSRNHSGSAGRSSAAASSFPSASSPDRRTTRRTSDDPPPLSPPMSGGIRSPNPLDRTAVGSPSVSGPASPFQRADRTHSSPTQSGAAGVAPLQYQPLALPPSQHRAATESTMMRRWRSSQQHPPPQSR